MGGGIAKGCGGRLLRTRAAHVLEELEKRCVVCGNGGRGGGVRHWRKGRAKGGAGTATTELQRGMFCGGGGLPSTARAATACRVHMQCMDTVWLRGAAAAAPAAPSARRAARRQLTAAEDDEDEDGNDNRADRVALGLRLLLVEGAAGGGHSGGGEIHSGGG